MGRPRCIAIAYLRARSIQTTATRETRPMTDMPHVAESILGVTARDWGLPAHRESQDGSPRPAADAPARGEALRAEGGARGRRAQVTAD
jgi:hypothetical protein